MVDNEIPERRDSIGAHYVLLKCFATNYAARRNEIGEGDTGFL